MHIFTQKVRRCRLSLRHGLRTSSGMDMASSMIHRAGRCSASPEYSAEQSNSVYRILLLVLRAMVYNQPSTRKCTRTYRYESPVATLFNPRDISAAPPSRGTRCAQESSMLPQPLRLAPMVADLLSCQRRATLQAAPWSAPPVPALDSMCFQPAASVQRQPGPLRRKM
jgi:hypothetical protein